MPTREYEHKTLELFNTETKKKLQLLQWKCVSALLVSYDRTRLIKYMLCHEVPFHFLNNSVKNQLFLRNSTQHLHQVINY